jgi:hypothetical protein
LPKRRCPEPVAEIILNLSNIFYVMDYTPFRLAATTPKLAVRHFAMATFPRIYYLLLGCVFVSFFWFGFRLQALKVQSYAVKQAKQSKSHSNASHLSSDGFLPPQRVQNRPWKRQQQATAEWNKTSGSIKVCVLLVGLNKRQVCIPVCKLSCVQQYLHPYLHLFQTIIMYLVCI